MPRPFIFPDPNDASPNKPSAFVDSDTIIGLYNQEHPDEPSMQNYTQKVVDWFSDYEINHGWDDAQPCSGKINGVLLKNDAVFKCKKVINS